eukprot:gene13062-15362_t
MSGRISFRPRPIDVAKPLQIVRTEIDDDDTSRMVPMMPTGMESNEEGELHIQEIIQASMKMKHDDLPEIPIPVVKIVDGYDTAENPHPFSMGSTYVLYKLLNDDELDQTTEYDLDNEDEAFVAVLNQAMRDAANTNTTTPSSGGTTTSKKPPLLTLDKFECILDRLEKEHYHTGQCDLSKAEQICKVIHELHEKLREYAHLKMLEPAPEEVTPPVRKKKDHSTSSSVQAGAVVPSTEAEPGQQAAPAIPHTYPGPIFANKEAQPLILGNGKARQEGYRHFIVRPGQFPTDSLEKQYGGDNVAFSPQQPGDEMEDEIEIQQRTAQQLLDEKAHQQQLLEAQRLKEEEDAANLYYNTLPTPTSGDYYDEPINNNKKQQHHSGKSNPYHTGSYSYTLQPQLNVQGKPVYPSVNQGYIFVSPNLPPMYGRARVGRYGESTI